MALAAPELMEPSATPGAQAGLPTGSWELSSVPSDYEDEFLRYLWRDYLYPKQYEWVLIAAYVAVFLVALVGNTLGRSLCLCGTVGFPWGLEEVLGLVSLPSSYLQKPGSVGEGLVTGRAKMGVALPLASPGPCPTPQCAWQCGGTTT